MQNDELAKQLKDGDVRVFEKIYKENARQIFIMASRLMKDSQEVEEVVQDIFFEFWQKRSVISYDLGYKSFLFTLARRRIIDRFRKQVNAVFLETIDDSIVCSYDIEGELHLKEMNSLMERRIEILPPKRKLIFKLRKEEGLTNKQIAKKLGVSTTMVEKQMKLAIQALREYFSHQIESSSFALILFFHFF